MFYNINMTLTNYPKPQRTLTKAEARRFMLAHQALWPPRSLDGKAAVIDFFRRVGCIQFDPINVVGWNPDLVLQARVVNYRPQLLDALLYKDRLLWDGWDKVQSIYLAEDWPYFSRRRAANRENHWFPQDVAVKIHPLILETIRDGGPICSLDIQQKEKIDGFWGVPVRVERAALENLYANGDLGIHHRVGTRRYFDLVERLLPAELLATPDPTPDEESYQDWHVLRRVGAAGLANLGETEYWGGILGVKANHRRATLNRLIEQSRISPIAVEEGPKQPFFMRTNDTELLERVCSEAPIEKRAALIAPLDNLIWQRDLVRRIFDFDYIWEVYKPAEKRQYGYYVLPVLYGDRFVARCEPSLERKTKQLSIRNWWWQEGIVPDEEMLAVLADCLEDFCAYLNAVTIQLTGAAAQDPFLRRLYPPI